MKVALYGINKGLQTLYSLLREQIYIDAVCVRRKEEAYSMLGKPCILYDEIKSHASEWKVILAPNDLAQENLESMASDGVDARIYPGEIDKRLYIADMEIDSLSVCFFLKENKNRSIYVYGTDDRAVAFVNKMRFLDCPVRAFITDKKGEEELCGLPVMSVFELLMPADNETNGMLAFDNNPMIILSRANKRIVRLLDDLGMVYGRNYCLMSSLRINERRGNRNAVWDLTLGHTYIDSMDEPKGFVKYGKNTAKRKIVILGGSTSDSYYTWFPSWPEIFAEGLLGEGYDIQVLNGAMCGYNIQQEFLKLVRDVMILQPDIVIDFSGTNNVGEARVSPENPYVPYYLLDISKRLGGGGIKYSRQTEDMAALNDQTGMEDVYYGNTTSKSCAESYVATLRMMNAVCKEFHIRFISFFQPNLWTKYGYWDEWEKNIVFCSSVSDLSGDRTDFRLKRAERYVEEVRSLQPDFQIDLTDRLTYEADVYMDTDHYTWKANKILAECVKGHLRDIL